MPDKPDLEIKFVRDYGSREPSPRWMVTGNAAGSGDWYASAAEAETAAGNAARDQPGAKFHVLAVMATVSTGDVVVGERFDPARRPTFSAAPLPLSSLES